MIYCTSTQKTNQHWGIAIPHEINNQFLGDLAILSQDKKIPYNFNLLGVSDFGDVIIPYEKLDDYLLQLETLINNLDDVIKYHPLPNTIWGFDGMRFKNFVIYSGDSEIPVSDEGLKLTKEDFLLLMEKLKMKASEAKEAKANIKFSGD